MVYGKSGVFAWCLWHIRQKSTSHLPWCSVQSAPLAAHKLTVNNVSGKKMRTVLLFSNKPLRLRWEWSFCFLQPQSDSESVTYYQISGHRISFLWANIVRLTLIQYIQHPVICNILILLPPLCCRPHSQLSQVIHERKKCLIWFIDK